MRTVIIGGTGHVGTYLVPYLVEAGHEVINLSRSQRQPYRPHGAWKSCLLYTSDAADDTPCVDLGGRRIIKKIF